MNCILEELEEFLQFGKVCYRFAIVSAHVVIHYDFSLSICQTCFLNTYSISADHELNLFKKLPLLIMSNLETTENEATLRGTNKYAMLPTIYSE